MLTGIGSRYLAVHAREIMKNMKMRTAYNIVSLIFDIQLSAENNIPSVRNKTVADVAQKEGIDGIERLAFDINTGFFRKNKQTEQPIDGTWCYKFSNVIKQES